ncbi:MAG: ABC transporter substrate-binding protein [Mesorhizobium sp.]
MFNIGKPINRRLMLGGSIATAGLMMAGSRMAAAATDLPMSVAGLDPHFSVFYVAECAGFFKDNDLNVGYINTQNGTNTRQALASGQIAATLVSPFDSMVMTLAGKKASLIFNTDRKMSYANVVVRKSDFDAGTYTKVEDLKGKKYGVTGLSSAFYIVGKYLTDRAGIADEIELRPHADTAALLGSLKSGQVQAITASFAMLQQAVGDGWGHPIFSIEGDEGWNSLVGGDLPGVCAHALDSTIESRNDDLQAMISALIKAEDYMLSHTPEELTELVADKFLPGFDKAQVTKAHALFQQALWTKNNIPTKEVFDRIRSMAVIGGVVEKAREDEVSYEKMVYSKFVEKARAA